MDGVVGIRARFPPMRVSQGFWGTRDQREKIEGNKGT